MAARQDAFANENSSAKASGVPTVGTPVLVWSSSLSGESSKLAHK
jgi:hypothetical protein